MGGDDCKDEDHLHHHQQQMDSLADGNSSNNNNNNNSSSLSNDNTNKAGHLGKDTFFQDSPFAPLDEDTQPSLGAASSNTTEEGDSSNDESSDSEDDGEECENNEDDALDDNEEEEDEDENEEDGDAEIESQRQSQSTEWKASFGSEDADEQDEYAEMTSLIGSSGGNSSRPSSSATNHRRLGLARLWGGGGRRRNRNSNLNTPEEKERQSLLDGDQGDDDDFDHKAYKDKESNQDCDSKSRSKDESSNDDSDDGSMEGEPQDQYQSDDYYHYKDYSDNGFVDGGQDLYQRIQGFGYSDSALVSGYSDNPAAEGRFLAQSLNHNSMSSMDIENRNEKRGLWHHVMGIRQRIKQHREQADEEKRRMLAYINELEFKLLQAEKESQRWRDRALALESQMREQQEESKDGVTAGDDIETSKDEGEVEEEEHPKELLQFTKIKTTETLDNSPSAEDIPEESGMREGALIDVSEKPPVFDPLSDNAKSRDQVVEEDSLMDAEKFQEAEQLVCAFKAAATTATATTAKQEKDKADNMEQKNQLPTVVG